MAKEETGGSRCFLDKDRVCGPDCKAYTSTAECRILRDAGGTAQGFRTILKWLGQHDPPKVR